MGDEELKKARSEAPSLPTPAEEHGPVKEEKEAPLKVDVNYEKSSVPVSEKVAADSPAAATAKSSRGSNDRDAVLASVAMEKRCALIKAWEENEKAKAESKAHKKISDIGSWETTQRASVEAKIKTFEEKMERKKAEYAEKMKLKVAEIRRAAEEKKATFEAQKGEDCFKVEETAAKFRATGSTPRKFLGVGCFGTG